jgi:hypothetical protein
MVMHTTVRSYGGLLIQLAALTQQREAAAAGDGFDLQVSDRPRDDGLHLAAEEFNTLRLLRARLPYELADGILELQHAQERCLATVTPPPSL